MPLKSDLKPMNSRKVGEMLSVGDVSKRTGVAVSTLHFYESKGLIVAKRNNLNQRLYERAVIRIVSIIKVAQSLGFSLDEIKESIASSKSKDLTLQDWKRLGKVWQRKLDIRINKMIKLREQLNDCIGCGCLVMQSCPLRNPSDQLASKGAGPQLL